MTSQFAMAVQSLNLAGEMGPIEIPKEPSKTMNTPDVKKKAADGLVSTESFSPTKHGSGEVPSVASPIPEETEDVLAASVKSLASVFEARAEMEKPMSPPLGRSRQRIAAGEKEKEEVEKREQEEREMLEKEKREIEEAKAKLQAEKERILLEEEKERKRLEEERERLEKLRKEEEEERKRLEEEKERLEKEKEEARRKIEEETERLRQEEERQRKQEEMLEKWAEMEQKLERERLELEEKKRQTKEEMERRRKEEEAERRKKEEERKRKEEEEKKKEEEEREKKEEEDRKRKEEEERKRAEEEEKQRQIEEEQKLKEEESQMQEKKKREKEKREEDADTEAKKVRELQRRRKREEGESSGAEEKEGKETGSCASPLAVRNLDGSETDREGRRKVAGHGSSRDRRKSKGRSKSKHRLKKDNIKGDSSGPAVARVDLSTSTQRSSSGSISKSDLTRSDFAGSRSSSESIPKSLQNIFAIDLDSTKSGEAKDRPEVNDRPLKSARGNSRAPLLAALSQGMVDAIPTTPDSPKSPKSTAVTASPESGSKTPEARPTRRDSNSSGWVTAPRAPKVGSASPSPVTAGFFKSNKRGTMGRENTTEGTTGAPEKQSTKSRSPSRSRSTSPAASTRSQSGESTPTVITTGFRCGWTAATTNSGAWAAAKTNVTSSEGEGSVERAELVPPVRGRSMASKKRLNRDIGPVPPEAPPKPPLEFWRRTKNMVPPGMTKTKKWHINFEGTKHKSLPTIVTPPLGNTFVFPPGLGKIDPYDELFFTPDIYKDGFFGKVHLSFVGMKHKSVVVVSVLKHLTASGEFWAVKTAKRDTTVFKINNNQIRQLSKKTEFTDIIEDYLGSIEPGFTFYHVPIPEFSSGLLQIEAEYPQNLCEMKVGFLYSDGTERTKEDLLNFIGDQPTTDDFWDFIDLLGHEIQLEGWKHYRGNFVLGESQEAYYTKWRGIEIMLHLSPWMQPHVQQKIISDDLCIVIFHDSNEPFDPTPLESLGSVPLFFFVVRPVTVEGKEAKEYKIEMFTRGQVKITHPLLPRYHTVAASCLKDFLYTKIYNSMTYAMATPPLCRPQEARRALALLALATLYPEPKCAKYKKKEKIKASQVIECDPGGTILNFTIVRGRELETSDGSEVNAYCVINLGVQETKTKTAKKTSEPEWNEECKFSAVGVNPLVDWFSIVVKQSTLVGGATVLGEVEIPLQELYKNGEGTEKWYRISPILTGAAEGEKEGEKKISDRAALCVKLAVTGPASGRCPKCNVFIGASNRIIYGDDKPYHLTCPSCTVCQKKMDKDNRFIRIPKADDEEQEKDDDDYDSNPYSFYCRGCYARIEGEHKADIDFARTDGKIRLGPGTKTKK